MKRLGVLLVFNEHVTRAEAEAALKPLRGLVGARITYPSGDYREPVRTSNPDEYIETFDDADGSPVWYIP